MIVCCDVCGDGSAAATAAAVGPVLHRLRVGGRLVLALRSVHSIGHPTRMCHANHRTHECVMPTDHLLHLLGLSRQHTVTRAHFVWGSCVYRKVCRGLGRRRASARLCGAGCFPRSTRGGGSRRHGRSAPRAGRLAVGRLAARTDRGDGSGVVVLCDIMGWRLPRGATRVLYYHIATRVQSASLLRHECKARHSASNMALQCANKAQCPPSSLPPSRTHTQTQSVHVGLIISDEPSIARAEQYLPDIRRAPPKLCKFCIEVFRQSVSFPRTISPADKPLPIWPE